ncbi:MAG: restriction endonuclease subunit S, partial [Sphaerospermopsis kisseleviana]
PDTDAVALLDKIKAEKQQLITEGKLKKEKPLPPISSDEVPFSLPDGWVWCRLGNVCKKITDGTHHSPINTMKGDYKYITAKNIKNFGIDLSNVTFVTKNIHEQIFQRCDPEKGDILFVKDGATTGIVTINNLLEPFSLLSSVALIKPLVLNKYLMYSMRSPIFYKSVRDSMFGVAITRVTLNKIINAIIPLPPLAEQKAIVEKVDYLMKQIEELEAQIKHRKQLAEELMQTVLR